MKPGPALLFARGIPRLIHADGKISLHMCPIPEVTVVGGGLAGSEAAWQAAQRGLPVRLYEMRPTVSTAAHRTSALAELVCSNSLGSSLPDRASGVLKNELRSLGSLLLECAESAALPAGNALDQIMDMA